MKLFKCYHCLNDKQVPGKDFQADRPVCPTCGVDGTDSVVGHLIVQCKLVHFEPPHPVVVTHGSGKIACGAKPIPGIMVTRAVQATNCPNCLATEAGVAALAIVAGGVDEFTPVGS